MPKNHIVKFSVDKEQFARLKADAARKGYGSLAAYMRDMAFNRSQWLEKLLTEIHQEVVKNEGSKHTD